MAEGKEALEESLCLYESQLEQVSAALCSSIDSSEELSHLRQNLQELIALTKENLDSLTTEVTDDDPLAEEYALFKAELENELSNEHGEGTEIEESIQDEISCLNGTKCRAPFSEKWSGGDSCSYHNALITDVDSSDSLDNIKVTVLFVNPICQEMIPCRYFLDGECKFSDDQCHFSHGYVVNFSDLKEYKEPDFSKLKESCPVLVKDSDNVWKRAIVTALISETSQCCVKFEFGRKEDVVVDFHNTLPLEEFDEDIDDGIHRNEKFKKDEEFEERQGMMVEKSLLQPPQTQLGEWEKYTKNIGSKLMASMGYVAGTGLGKHGEGRIEPVTATVLPAGKSLDHCMALREAAGGDPNLFNAEKLQKKIKRKILVNCRKKKKLAAIREKKSNDVFTFLNKSLADNSIAESKFSGKDALLKQTSSKELNVKELKISENMQKKNYELMVLREKLSRQKSNTVGHNTLMKKIDEIERHLITMHSNLHDVHQEKNYRQTFRDLAEF